MAHRGAAPKAVKHGRNPTADWTDVPDDPFEGPSPELPRLPGRRKWHELVVSWWEQVRVMPHCVLWGPTDWQFALETALMKQHFWADYADGTLLSTAATEIRRREDQIGTTLEARRKLRIRYVPVAEESQVVAGDDTAAAPAGGVVSLADRRARLTA